MPNIYISAGEASGDLLGANLASALLQRNPNVHLTGMGGKKMKAAGVSLQFDSDTFALMGVVEIVKHLPRIVRTLHHIKKYLRQTKPDLVILIDLPDTHFRIMKMAKKYHIPVLYYVSPQLWAWRSGRIQQIQQYVDHMAVLFSFEKKIYDDANVPATFVGHPLADIAKPTLNKSDSYDLFGLNTTDPVVALFPGSRRSEMATHLSLIIDSTEKIKEKNPSAQFVLALAPHFNVDDIRKMIPSYIKIVQHHLYDLLQITHAAIAVSGTVTLEIGLLQVPLCIIYKCNRLTFWILQKLVRLKNIGLCNIVAEKIIAKEFIQDAATADAIASEIITILSDTTYSEKIKNELSVLREKITSDKNASEAVTEVATKLLNSAY